MRLPALVAPGSPLVGKIQKFLNRSLAEKESGGTEFRKARGDRRNEAGFLRSPKDAATPNDVQPRALCHTPRLSIVEQNRRVNVHGRYECQGLCFSRIEPCELFRNGRPWQWLSANPLCLAHFTLTGSTNGIRHNLVPNYGWNEDFTEQRRNKIETANARKEDQRATVADGCQLLLPVAKIAARSRYLVASPRL